MEREEDRSSESCSGEEVDQPQQENPSLESIEGEFEQEETIIEDTKAPVIEKPKTPKSKKSVPTKKSKNKIIFNVIDAQYDVVRNVGKDVFKWELSTNPNDDWDICWMDKTTPMEVLAKMRPYQKVNHFPGILSIARKNNLGKNLMKMRKLFPDNYKFFPPTYLLPTDFQEFKNQFTKDKKSKTFILKPEGKSQGKGIFLTKTWEKVNPQEKLVAQKYLKNPYLIDGLKFDLRIYVLLAGCDPLRIFLHKEGLGRFSTEKYCPPTNENLNNTCMHLTNYAINKENPNFVFNNSSTDDDVGHKKSLKAVFKILEEQGHDVNKLWEEIKKIIIKTFCSVQPTLAHNYRSCHPNEPYNNMCFEVLGFDIMLDSKVKPWLIEVNHLPSFTTDTPLDTTIKHNVVSDALRIMHVTSKEKINFKNKRKAEIHQRSMYSKKTRMTPEERQTMFDNAQKERDDWEDNHLGGFEKIYPLDENAENVEDYKEYIKASNQHWQAWTGADIRRNLIKSAPKVEQRDSSPGSEEESQVIERPTVQPPSQKRNVDKSVTRSPIYTGKRTSASKNTNGPLNESNSSTAASTKTALSFSMKPENLHGEKDGFLGPWENRKLTEGSDTSSFDNEPLSRWRDIDAIEENNNDDEDFLLSKKPNPLEIFTKSARALPKTSCQTDAASVSESILTQREASDPKSPSSGVTSKNISYRAKSCQRPPSLKPQRSLPAYTPKKVVPPKVAPPKSPKQSQQPSVSKAFSRAMSPDRPVREKPERATAKAINVYAPSKTATPKPEKKRGEEKAVDKSQEVESALPSPSKFRTPKVHKRRPSKVKNDEENEGLPKKITLSLTKEALAPAMNNLAQVVKKAFPATPTLIKKPSHDKVNTSTTVAQNQVSTSPQYYQVQLLGKNSSGLKVVEIKQSLSKKDLQKSEILKKKNAASKKDLTIEEVETSDKTSDKTLSLLKDLGNGKLAKYFQLTPKTVKTQVTTQVGNFFK